MVVHLSDEVGLRDGLTLTLHGAGIDLTRLTLAGTDALKASRPWYSSIVVASTTRRTRDWP